MRRSVQICAVLACLVPMTAPVTLSAQKQAGWRFWDASDGLVESFSIVLGKGPDGRLWVRHGDVRSMSVLDGYSVRIIPEPRAGLLDDFQGHRMMRRVYGGPGQHGWTVANGQLKEFDGQAWKVRLKPVHSQQPQERILAAVPRADKVLVLYPDRLVEFDPASSSVTVLKRNRDTSIGAFRELVVGFENEALVAGSNGVGRMRFPSSNEHAPAPSLDSASLWTQCDVSAMGLGDVEHLLPGDAGEIFFSGTIRRGPEKRSSAAAVWDGVPGDRPAILYRDPQQSVRVWRGPDQTLWLLQGSSLFWLVDGRKEPVEHTGPLSGSILDVLAEPRGAFWVSGSDGLAHYTPPTWRTPPEVSSLNEPFGKILADPQGRLWSVGVRHLVELDGSTWTIRSLPSNIRDSTAQSSAFCTLPDERLAIQTQESEKSDRLLIFDVRHRTFQKITHPLGRSISGFVCRPAGGLWVTTAPGLELEIYDGRDFHPVADLSQEWHAGTLRQLFERGADLIVMANGGAGVVRQGHFLPFGPADGFTESGGFSMTDTGREIIAAGRQDLLSYDGRRWTKLAGGLMPRAAKETRDGTLWVASFTGVHQFRNAARITNTEADGLPSDHVRNIFEDRQGRIWAATNDGLSLYHRDADAGRPRSLLSGAHNPLEIPPGGAVRIHLAGADQWKRTQPQDLLFAYRLDDGPWHPFAAAETAAFDDVPAGPHRLQARVMDRNGNAGTASDTWNFLVLSPWYRNPTFLLLFSGALLCIFSLLGLAAFNYRKLGRLVVQLNRSRIAAEQASRCKTEFLANMSHEIRTPMNAIMGMSQLAMETPSGEEQQEFLRNVTAASESLLGLLNDVLDLSKIEAGKLELSAVDFRLRDCLDGLVSTLGLRAKEKGLAFRTQIHPGVPGFLHGDDQRLRQVLINLAGNALKFTAQGFVTVEVTLIADAASGAPAADAALRLHFVVRDTGRGVAPERQAAIFGAFEQGGDSTARNYGGTGLGLAISARIAEMMQGRIWAESPWKDPATGACITGSAFHFEACLAPGQDPPAKALAPVGAPEPAAASALGRLRILLAEDNSVNQLLAVRRLSKDGHHVLVAADGEEAVAIFQREPVDLILMDIQMPKMDGFQAAAAIRRLKRSSGPHVPIIALTAHALEGFRQQALDAGMNAFVTKPIRFAELRRAMSAVLAGQRAPQWLETHPES